MMNWTLVTAALFLLTSSSTGEKGCPEADEILPCTCVQAFNPPYLKYLRCENLSDSDTLKRVFQNSARHSFYQVSIKDSILNYIPHELFEDISIYELVIRNLTLTDIFDEPPKALQSLKKFELTDTKVLRGVIWELLGPLTELEELNIFGISVKTLKQDFARYASPTIKQILFQGSKIKTLKPGVFTKLINLERLYIDHGDLQEIRRDSFPKPFNSIYLIGFNNNSIETVPDDMFTDMPNLKLLGLAFNKISLLSSTAFGGRADNLNHLDLGGNPLRCDCRLYWLIKDKPKYLIGGCDSPQRLQGKSLAQLTDNDLNCF